MDTQPSHLTTKTVMGTVKGPGEGGNQYIFITSENSYVRIGEFVYYEIEELEQPSLKILGKISDRRLIDHLPDRLFADTETNPQIPWLFLPDSDRLLLYLS